jgi:hypothetical protein
MHRCERARRQGLARRFGPSGEHLIELIGNTDELLEAVLRLAGRERILSAERPIDARERLVEALAFKRARAR